MSLLTVLTVFTIAWFPSTPIGELFFGTAQQLSLRDSARFAEQFALTFMLAQLGVLALLTPAYASGGIAEEKEKKTFVFLLVSDLTSREIVLGKFVGRLGFLLGVMLAGLPVLALTLLYGGVSVKFLLMGYFLTATTVTLLAAVGVVSACYAETFRGALFRSYGLGALHMFAGCGMHPVLSPFGIIAMLFAMEAGAPEAFVMIGLGYGSVQLICAVIAVYLATRSVRALRYGPGRPPPEPRRRRQRDDRPRDVRFREAKRELFRDSEDLPFRPNDAPLPVATPLVKPSADWEVVPEPTPAPAPPPDYARNLPRAEVLRPPTRRRLRQAPLPKEIANRPPVDPVDPFLWKETYISGHRRDADDDSIRGLIMAVGVIVGLLVGFVLLITFLVVLASGISQSSLKGAQSVLMIGGSMGYFVYLLTLGAAGCGAICRERQKQTLESLLTIPCDRQEILWAKWRVCLTKGWWWGIPAAVCIPLGLMAWAMSVEKPSWMPGKTGDLQLPFQLAAISGAVFVAATIPLAVSLGLWLSARCHTITRAILWFLPVAGGVTLIPLLLWGISDASSGKLVLMLFTAAAGVTLFTAWMLWVLCHAAFEKEGRN